MTDERITKLEQQVTSLRAALREVQAMAVQNNHAIHGDPAIGHNRGLLREIITISEAVAKLEISIEGIIKAREIERKQQEAAEEERKRLLKLIGGAAVAIQLLVGGGYIAALLKILELLQQVSP